MILNKNVMETDSFLDVNNDIYHMITIFNNCQELKKLLVYTDKKPLERKEDVKVISCKLIEEDDKKKKKSK